MELVFSKGLDEESELIAKIEWYDSIDGKRQLVAGIKSEQINIESDLMGIDYTFYIENASSLDLAKAKTLDDLKRIMLWQQVQWQIVKQCIKQFYPKVGFEYIHGVEIPDNVAFVFDYKTFNDLCSPE